MRVFMAAAALVAGLLSVATAEAQTWPNKTVKIIVPYQAGQGTDVATRYFADQLTKALGQTFYVDNKPGAGGNIGTEAAAHSQRIGRLLDGTDGLWQRFQAGRNVDTITEQIAPLDQYVPQH